MRSFQKHGVRRLPTMAAFSTALAFAVLSVGCSKTETPKPPVAAATATPAATPASADICGYEEALQEGVTGISKQDAQTVCRTMRAELGRDPSPKLLGTMQKFLFGMRANFAVKDSPDHFASEVLGVVKARQQIDAEDAKILDTFNVVAKCYSGSQGRVTPRAIGTALHAAGDAGKSMSDDGIYTLCAMIESQA
jgi:hypothetical protein